MFTQKKLTWGTFQKINTIDGLGGIVWENEMEKGNTVWSFTAIISVLSLSLSPLLGGEEDFGTDGTRTTEFDRRSITISLLKGAKFPFLFTLRYLSGKFFFS